jgi:repressor LexA
VKPEPTGDQVRATLGRLAKESGHSLAALSRMIRRGDDYLARFVAGGPPNRLADKDRHLLAMFFRVNERELGKWDNP